MAFSLQASLRLWQARVRFRKDLHTRAQKDLDRARAKDIHPRQHLVDRRDLRSKQLAEARAMVAKRKAQLAPPSKPGVWMPGVVHDPRPSIGACTVGAKAGLLHTTEGLDFGTMDNVLKAKGAEPHFLVGRSGEIKQYRPVGDAATALRNLSGGVETNRKRVIQIEVCAFANFPNWPDPQKRAVARVMGFCHGHGVPLTCSVKFTGSSSVRRLSGQDWIAYSGWLGHQHAPENDHWDPGAIDISELLKLAANRSALAGISQLPGGTTVSDSTSTIHPKVAAGGKVGLVVTALAAVLALAGVELPDPAGLTDAILVFIGAASAVIAGFRKSSEPTV